MSDDEKVRFTVQMPKSLREDAKRNSDRGDLSEATREVFRRKAYGMGSGAEVSRLDEKRAELEDVREKIDDKRGERSQLDSEIRTLEARANRIEEQIESLREERDELSSKLDVLENMLHDGDRMWPVRIKNAVDVDPTTADELYQQLRNRNAELPEAAFTEPKPHEPKDWTDVADTE